MQISLQKAGWAQPGLGEQQPPVLGDGKASKAAVGQRAHLCIGQTRQSCKWVRLGCIDH